MHDTLGITDMIDDFNLVDAGVSHCYWHQGVKECVNQDGIGFMMSPIYHPAMKIVRPIRKELKVKTVFNILGSMLNSAIVPVAVVGVYKEDLCYLHSFDERSISGHRSTKWLKECKGLA